MKQLPLKEIAQIEQGVCPYSNEVWLLNLDMVESKTGRIIEYQYVPQNEIGSSTVSFDCSNVLYSKLRPYLNKVVLPQKCGYATSEMIPLKPKTDIITREYLAYFLRSNDFVNYINSKTYGAKMPRVNVAELKSVQVPCPSLVKQKEITQLLDKLITLIDMEREQLKAYDDLIKSRFVELFGDLEAGTCIHPTKKLKALSLKISDGVHAKPEYTEKGKPFLSVMNINKRIVDFTNCKFVSEEAYQKMIKSTHPQKGDVLYTKVGATYGIPAYVDTDREFCLYVSVCLIKPKHELINSKFLALQMDMPFVKFQADKRIKGIGVPDLHLNQISDFDIICPPRYMQDEFVAFVEQVDKLKVVAQKRFDETQMLFDSLMQQYFG